MLSATGFDGVDGEGNAVDAQFGSAAVDVDEAVIVMLIYYGCCAGWVLVLARVVVALVLAGTF